MSDSSIADYVFDNSFVFSNKSVNSNGGPKVLDQKPVTERKKLKGQIKRDATIPVDEVYDGRNKFLAICPLATHTNKEYQCIYRVSAFNKEGAIKTIRRHIRDSHRVVK